MRRLRLNGRDAPAIEAALAGSGVPLHHGAAMDEAVRIAFEAAKRGDAVLLSPACASFDMFRNYGHRGQVFADAARSLAAPARPTPDS